MTTKEARPTSLPSYHDILAEFERRTTQHPQPAPGLPSPVDVFEAFEQRTGQKM